MDTQTTLAPLLQTALIPTFSLMGVGLGAALQFISGRALESKKQIEQQKYQSYIDYFKGISTIAQNRTSKDGNALIVDAKVRICIYGSQGVISHLRKIEESGGNTSSPETRAEILKLINAMRKDIGKTSSELDEASLQIVLFGNRPFNA